MPDDTRLRHAAEHLLHELERHADANEYEWGPTTGVGPAIHAVEAALAERDVPARTNAGQDVGAVATDAALLLHAACGHTMADAEQEVAVIRAAGWDLVRVLAGHDSGAAEALIQVTTLPDSVARCMAEQSAHAWLKALAAAGWTLRQMRP